MSDTENEIKQIKQKKTDDIDYFKKYYQNKKQIVKCDRCDNQVNFIGLNSHYKTRICSKIYSLKLKNENKIDNNEICILYDENEKIKNNIKDLINKFYENEQKIKDLEPDYIIKQLDINI